MNWYKYPLRGASCNRSVTFEEFKEIVDAFAAHVADALNQCAVEA